MFSSLDDTTAAYMCFGTVLHCKKTLFQKMLQMQNFVFSDHTAIIQLLIHVNIA